MFDKQGLQSDDLLLFEQYRLSNLLSSFDENEFELQSDSNEKRCELFVKYLERAERMIHFESLIQILNNLWSEEQLKDMRRYKFSSNFFVNKLKSFRSSHGLTLKTESNS